MVLSSESRRRGPALGGVCLGKTTDSSETRGRARLSARQSVQCVPVMARSLGTTKPEGTHKERSQKRIALALEVCTTASHGDVERTPMIGMRAGCLLVLDLKAAGALPSLAVAEADCQRSHTIMIALPCMYIACPD